MEALEFAQEELAPRGEENVNIEDPIFQPRMHFGNIFFFAFQLVLIFFLLFSIADLCGPSFYISSPSYVILRSPSSWLNWRGPCLFWPLS